MKNVVVAASTPAGLSIVAIPQAIRAIHAGRGYLRIDEKYADIELELDTVEPAN
ncbi:hypothetical protein GCM10023084_41010 [Streptomyces lacrimifluminis]|uniref:Uncharacterized protein n=1 Tax=Streptomyces lacrimifluminis TaxID=1500077 RepID=A0A917L267_9ACTN|nr:hypothetical protein GCM10012282_42640 [Streptomyces lacrimifluminis]